MKNLSYLLSLVVLVGAMALIGCGDDSGGGPTIEEQQLSAIVGTWGTSADADVTLGGNNAPGDWSSFTITFTNAKGVSVANDDPTGEVDIFNVNSFEFSNENITNIGLTFDGEPATIQVNSATEIVFSFDLAEGEQLGARKASVAGSWTFNLTKQQ